MLWRASIALALLAAAGAARAEVITDGSLGSVQTLAGPNFAITADLGRTAGANLFHSFRRFNLSSGETATFSGPARIANIFGRVTGGASSIDGTIRSTIAGADLFLINPAGIVFGPNARLDVSGSFRASSAGAIDFEDGGRFLANPAGSSQFTSAAPAAFGFLTVASAPVTVQAGAMLSPGSGKQVTLAGGSLAVGGQVQTVGGSIRLTALATPGSVPFDVTQPSTGTRGDIAIVGGQVRLLGSGPGLVRVEAADLSLDGGRVLGVNTGAADATGGILVESGSLTGANGAQIATTTAGAGKSGDVVVATGPLALSENSVIAADTVASGGSGQVVVNASSIDLSGSAEIHSNTGVFSAPTVGGPAGGVSVTASGLINLTGQGSIGSTSFAAGDAGPATVSADRIVAIGTIDPVTQAVAGIGSVTAGSGNANDTTVVARQIDLRNNATITSSTFGAGNGGSVSVTTDDILLAGLANNFETGIQSNAGDVITGQNGVPLGAAGNVTVTAGNLNVLNFASVASNTFGQQPAGTVTVRANSVTVAAETQDDGLPVQLLFTGIFTNSQPTATATATGGAVDVAADTINILGTASIGANTFSDAAAGSVRVDARNVLISGRLAVQSAGIASQSLAGAGAAGNVRINADTMQIQNFGAINSGTLGAGVGGTVTVNIGTRLDIVGGNVPAQTGISADVIPADLGGTATGDAGDVLVSAPTGAINLSNGGTISSTTFSRGDAGNVTVVADNLNIVGAPTAGVFTGIFSQTQPELQADLSLDPSVVGRAGSVTVRAGDISISRNGVISSSTLSNKSGGRVAVTADRGLTIIGVDNGQLTGISSSASFVNGGSAFNFGNAGLVSVTAGRIDISQFGQINSSTATFGNAGAVSVTAGRIDITGTPSMLNSNVVLQTGIFSGASVTAGGNGGSVTVNANDINVNTLGSIQAATAGPGIAGTVNIAAGTLDVVGSNARISSDALRANAGNAGGVGITANAITVANGGAISSSTISSSGGNGGNVRIEANSLTALNGGQVSATSNADPSIGAGLPGSAGEIRIFVDTLNLLSGGKLTTIASNAGGGRMVVSVKSLIQLVDGSITSTVMNGAGNGGDVNVVGVIPVSTMALPGPTQAPPSGPISDAQIAAAGPTLFVILQNGLIQANAIDGRGGDINIRAGNILSSASVIQATSQNNVDGTINIDAPDTDAASGLAVLPAALVDAAQRLAQQCAARGGRTLASFTGVGRGRVPLAPGAPVPATYLADLDRDATTASAAPRVVFVPATLRLACQPDG